MPVGTRFHLRKIITQHSVVPNFLLLSVRRLVPKVVEILYCWDCNNQTISFYKNASIKTCVQVYMLNYARQSSFPPKLSLV